jgi:hypothetical protein
LRDCFVHPEDGPVVRAVKNAMSESILRSTDAPLEFFDPLGKFEDPGPESDDSVFEILEPRLSVGVNAAGETVSSDSDVRSAGRSLDPAFYASGDHGRTLSRSVQWVKRCLRKLYNGT